MISELEDLLVHEEDEWSGSDKEEGYIDDDESDAEEEDLKRKKNRSSETNDDVGDDVLTDLKTKESEGSSDIESDNKEEECEAEKDHGSGEDGTEIEVNRISGLRRSERNKDKPRHEYSLKRLFGYLERGSKKSSLSFDEAMQSEENRDKKSSIDFLHDHEKLSAFEIVTKPVGVNVIGSRWVCKKKYDANGNLLQFKPWLTPPGYQQNYGVDHGETFAFVAMNGTNPLLPCVAAHWGRYPKKGDVTNSFQTTELMHSMVYMEIPEGFQLLVPEVDRDKCCLLWYNGINGLKQFGHDFNKNFDGILKRSSCDSSFYLLRNSG